MIKCKICHRNFKIITNTHLISSHNITIDEYLDKYPNSKIICNKTLERLRKQNKTNVKEKNTGFFHLSKERNFRRTQSLLMKQRWNEDYEYMYRIILKNIKKATKSRIVKRYTINCEKCGNEFKVTKYGIKCGRRFCSRECFDNSEYKRNIAINNLPKVQDNTKCYHLVSDAGYREDIGHFVRSSWEANFCRILIKSNIKYKYEKKEFELSNGQKYIPDFYLPEYKLYIEIKGYKHPKWIKKFNLFRKEYSDVKISLIDEENYYEIIEQFIKRK